MWSRARSLLAVGVGLLCHGAASGQGVWVGHQPPCKLSTSYYLIKGSVMDLKLAVESRFPDQRDGRLRDAEKVVKQAILEKEQGENPAAWYYLGRVYTETLDLVGADSAFRRARDLAPDCASDIALYTTRLAALGLNDALRTWGAGNRDSARVYFAHAQALDTADAEIPLFLSIMFASVNEPDSAAHFLDQGLVLSTTDTAHAARLRQAELEVARAYEARAYQDAPAIQTVSQTRLLRDSAAIKLASDSALYDKIVGEVSGIRSGGQHLNAQSLAAFQRDSTTLATRIADGHRAIDSLSQTAAADSANVAAALAPAVRYYRQYLDHHPDDAEAALELLRLYSALGERAALGALVARVAGDRQIPVTKLTQAGLSLFNDGLTAEAQRLLEAGLTREPDDYSTLGVLTHVYRAQGQADALMHTAEHRLELAPLDPGAARAMALAWDLRGLSDSTRRWLAIADTGLVWNVTVTQFQGGAQPTSLNGYVANVTRRPVPAIHLAFEFRDSTGTVVVDTTVAVPALDQRGRVPLALRFDRTGALSWRYRRE